MIRRPTITTPTPVSVSPTPVSVTPARTPTPVTPVSTPKSESKQNFDFAGTIVKPSFDYSKVPSTDNGLPDNRSSVVEEAQSLMQKNSKGVLGTSNDGSTEAATQRVLQTVASSLLSLLKGSDNLVKAQDSGQRANQFQDSFNEARKEFDNGQGENPSGTKGMFYNGAHAVMNRNNELNNLRQYVQEADVNPGNDRAVFWSGSQLNDDRSVKFSAMNTAQAYARDNDKVTVELTPGGHELDNYMGHENSFGDIKERFDFISQPEGPRSNAGALWDVLSDRFAEGATGNITAIHAANSDDSYFSSSAYLESTWKSIEEPKLKENGAQIDEKFGDDIEEYLSEA